MTKEGEPANAKITLPDSVKDYLDTCIEGYGLDAVTQGVRDCCVKRVSKHGVDATRLTPGERRNARLWRFGQNAYERCLQAVLDHGPGSGCK